MLDWMGIFCLLFYLKSKRRSKYSIGTSFGSKFCFPVEDMTERTLNIFNEFIRLSKSLV